MDTKQIERLRAAIIKQADLAGPDGWMEIPVAAVVSPRGRLRVPRGAFEQWAVRPSGAEHLAAPWRAISPQGLKQGADDPFHTDWMLGAGLGPKDMRPDGPNPALAAALTEAAYSARAEVDRRLLDFDCSVLLAGPAVVGRAWHPSSPDDLSAPHFDEPPIAVLRDARPEWLPVVMEVLSRGGAVVLERGGGMAHLVNEARGNGSGPIVRRASARRLYPADLLVKVDPEHGRIEIQDDWGLPPRMSVPSVEEFMVAAPPEPEPRPADEPKPFNLVRCGSDNPADRCTYVRMDRSGRLNGINYCAYGAVNSHEPNSRVCELVIRIYRRGDGDGRFVANYYAGSRDWSYGDLERAMAQAIQQYERWPTYEEIVARERAVQQARVDSFLATLRAMSDDELVAFVRDKAESERRFHAELEEGKWNWDDERDISRDYDDFFWHAGMELMDRGLPDVERAPYPQHFSP